eukprot:COSAG02_NODE_2637_length_8357_cov_7.120974_7_plen_100_part_00
MCLQGVLVPALLLPGPVDLACSVAVDASFQWSPAGSRSNMGACDAAAGWARAAGAARVQARACINIRMHARAARAPTSRRPPTGDGARRVGSVGTVRSR